MGAAMEMQNLLALMQTSAGWIAAILLLGIILFIHESGHYLMAVLNGVAIEEFGFGFPPRMLTLFTWRGTIFSLNWIPFGAYVRPKGEDDPTVQGGLAAASKRVRIMVLLGGVAANFLVGLACFTIVSKIAYPEPSVVLIAQVVKDSPADLAGILPGDRVLKVDSQAVTDTTFVRSFIYSHLGQEVEMQIQRGESIVLIHLTPRVAPTADQGPTGVVLGEGISDRHSWGEAFMLAGKTIVDQITLLFQLPMMLIQGQLSLTQNRPVGPVGIVDISEQVITIAAQQNQWLLILRWTGLINIALAIGNLLPIPAVDGGRLVFVLWEALRRKRVNPAIERWLIVATMMLLLLCLSGVTILDIFYPVLPR
jgi:regulator of sigma E protease